MADLNLVGTPMDPSMTVKNIPTMPNKDQHLPYWSIVGRLSYTVHSTQPNIAYTINSLSHQYSHKHWTATKHVLHYLHGMTSLVICFNQHHFNLMTAQPLHQPSSVMPTGEETSTQDD
jgi:hypothetical protein